MKNLFGKIFLITQFSNVFCFVRDDCVCGQMNSINEPKNIGNRIVNGTEVYPHKYPWMVPLQVFYELQWTQACTASIITDRTVLSAVHCVETRETLKHRILTGMHDIIEPKIDQIYYSESLIKHPLFAIIEEIPFYDVLLIVVDRTIQFNSVISPICLPLPNYDKLFWNQEVTISGWGETYWDDIKVQKPLIESKVILISDEDCNNIESPLEPNPFVEVMMCTYNNYTRACRGDSGGPLMGDYKGEITVLGVASFMLGQCIGIAPDVFAKITAPYTIRWIHDVTKQFNGNECKNLRSSFMRF